MNLSNVHIRNILISSNLLPHKFIHALKYLNKRVTHINYERNVNISDVQKGFSNFYPCSLIQPWVVKCAKGPWIITEDNKFVYDAGGYGMLGFGHNPASLMHALSSEHVMANIATPNTYQSKFWDKLKLELPDYVSIMALNSGSEVNSLAMRIANIHRHPKSVRVSMRGSFHGRTDNPAQVSASCQKIYHEHLHDFQNKKKTYFIEYNNVHSAIEVFKSIEAKHEFPEITLIEPIQGEGNPGEKITREFYSTIRDLTYKAGGLLLVDSIQSGWRCTGELSITKYPGFEDVVPPDMETFSKAINGGQFPFSILALNTQLANNFVKGLYGNTMTGNPRALHIGLCVLNEMNNDVRKNIRNMGEKMLKRLNCLVDKYESISHASGTGLLLALHLRENLNVIDVERALRLRGLNVIHGGENAIRFTPWFYICEDEINLIISIVDKYFSDTCNFIY